VKVLLLLIVGVIFLTGLVWWVLLIANAVSGSLRKR
jgi:hypothetical protein